MLKRWLSRVAVLAVMASAAGAQPALASRKPAEPPPALVLEHTHPSGRFSLHTPAGWKAAPSPTEPEAWEIEGPDVFLRFVYRQRENGYDSLHADCMLDRLAGPMDTSPQVEYEYDYVGGAIMDRRALDSAFIVKYDNDVKGHRVWRQRNVTIVGGGESLCVISYVPAPLWKKSAPTRALVDSVMRSLKFAPESKK